MQIALDKMFPIAKTYINSNSLRTIDLRDRPSFDNGKLYPIAGLSITIYAIMLLCLNPQLKVWTHSQLRVFTDCSVGHLVKPKDYVICRERLIMFKIEDIDQKDLEFSKVLAEGKKVPSEEVKQFIS